MSATDATTGRARLFFALWPAEDVRETLAALARQVQLRCAGRAIPPEKIHLTLFYVGYVERARMRAIEAAAGALHAAAFELALDVLGYWRRNRIAWAGTQACPAGLSALVAALCEALARVGLQDEGEDRPYAPHVTLVRDAVRAPTTSAPCACVWRASEFVLVESVPAARGVRYEVRSRWPLYNRHQEVL